MRLYSFNTHIFDTINHSSAYWLGFLIGDGSVSSTENRLTLELSNKDIDHLFKFKEFIGATHPIKGTRKNCSAIYLYDKEFINRISKYGLVPNKTKTIEVKNIPKKYLTDYYRGVLDSDGWITGHYNCHIPHFEFGFSSGNIMFLENLKIWLETQLRKNIRAQVRNISRGKWNVAQFIVGGNYNFINIARIFYNHPLYYLSRKFNKVKEILEGLKVDTQFMVNDGLSL